MRSVVLVLAAGMCCSLAVGCGSGGDGNATSKPATAKAEPTTTTPERRPVPAIAGTSLEGEPISLADYRGHPVLVNVWSSW